MVSSKKFFVFFGLSGSLCLSCSSASTLCIKWAGEKRQNYIYVCLQVKQSEEKATSERSKTDKLRERRHKKLRQKAIAAREEKKLDPDSKEKALLDLKKAARGNRDLKIVSDKKAAVNYTGNMTSSTFFTQLNDQQKMKSDKSKKKDIRDQDSKRVAKFKL